MSACLIHRSVWCRVAATDFAPSFSWGMAGLDATESRLQPVFSTDIMMEKTGGSRLPDAGFPFTPS